jgi:hypothetical protein
VKDADEIAPDGTTIKGRMQEIVKATADDIKACANVSLYFRRWASIDLYCRHATRTPRRSWLVRPLFHIFHSVPYSPIVKILKGPVWEGKLAAFAATFTKRRSEFEFALSIHTALGVDAANQTLGSVDKTTQEMNQKMDMMVSDRFYPLSFV